MFDIVITVLGAAISAVYIGFLAYSIKSVPLWVIVVLSFAIMTREFVLDLREGRRRGAAIASQSKTTER
ncbi:MAG TPA: hypothetical protein VLY46_11460 [Usitatibacter sp.]|nr:hypothetical protein [Usitatibacter sp.]